MALEVQDPKKMLKIVSCAETEKLKETMVEPQVEQVGDHQYLLGSTELNIVSESLSNN